MEIAAEKDPSKTGIAAFSFDRECLAAPAETRFTIRFDNRDPETHNVSILDHPGGTALFTGEVITETTTTYRIDPLPPGNYYFKCDIHPLAMNGTFIVAG